MKKSMLLAAVCLVAVFVSCASETDKKEFRLSTNQNTTSEYYTMLTNLAAKLETETGGAEYIKIYPDATLGDQIQNIELVKSGSIEMASVNAAGLENFVPIFGGFNLPYVLNGVDHARSVVQSKKLMDFLREESKSQNIVPLILLDGNSRNFFGTKPYLTPADMRGQKFRIMPSPLYTEIVQSLGGVAIPMNFGELFTSLQQGVVDGSENNPSVMYGSKLGEVVKHYTFTETTRNIDVVIMSLKTWESLTDEQRAVWLKISDESAVEFLGTILEIHNNYMKQAEDELDVKFHTTDTKPFQDATAHIVDKWIANDPKKQEFVDIIRSLED